MGFPTIGFGVGISFGVGIVGEVVVFNDEGSVFNGKSLFGNVITAEIISSD